MKKFSEWLDENVDGDIFVVTGDPKDSNSSIYATRIAKNGMAAGNSFIDPGNWVKGAEGPMQDGFTGKQMYRLLASNDEGRSWYQYEVEKLPEMVRLK